MFDALIYDSDEEVWLRFTDASAVHIAKTNEDVAAVLDTIEAACAEGKYAVGYVSFEAAGAFDCALVHHPAGSLPLAAFAVFDKAEEASPEFMSGAGAGSGSRFGFGCGFSYWDYNN